MAITKERFEQGMSYQAYKEQMTRNQERFANNERHVEISGEDVAFFANLKKPLYLMALAEDWCGDVINNLPVVGKLAEKSPNLHLSIFLRDQNLDLMDQYLKEGQFRSIPVFAFFDENFKDLGHFIERPASISAKMAALASVLTSTIVASKSSGRPSKRPTTPPQRGNCSANFRTCHGLKENNAVSASAKKKLAPAAINANPRARIGAASMR